MDDHFWPSLYPGLIVGGLLGLARGGLGAILAGAAGGVAGAAIAYFAMAGFGLDDGILSLAALVVGSVIGSYALTALYAYVAQHR
jgi:hypothetical protein